MFSKEFIKDNFYFNDDLVYMNHGTFGICPKPVLEAKFEILREFERNPVIEYATTMFDGCLESTKLLADRIGIRYTNLAILANATQGVWSILQSIDARAGEEILLTNYTYEAVRMIVEEILVPKGLIIRTLEMEPPFESNDKIIKMYTEFVLEHPNIKYAIIDHIPSMIPMVQPVKDIVAALRKLGVFVIIDGAHGPGQLKDLNLREVDADAYIGNLYKWYFVPRGLAFIGLREGSMVELRPPIVSYLHKKELYLRFIYMGTNDVSNILCIKHAFNFVDSLGGLEAIHTVIVRTLNDGVAYLEHAWNVSAPTFPEMAPFTRLVPFPDGFARHKEYLVTAISKVFQKKYYAATLSRFNFIATAVHVNGRLYFRLSCHIYVTRDHFVKFAERVMSWLQYLDNGGVDDAKEAADGGAVKD